jgi:Dockerin type I domain
VTRYLIAVDTTLARELKPDDTSIELTDATGWSNFSSDPNTRALAWYGYRDANGNLYENYSYTRNVRLNLESLWHNQGSSLDVNDDGVISPIDALLVINFLNTARGPVSQLVRPSLAPLFLDTSNDGNLSPIDALLVIIELNRLTNGEGEIRESKETGTAVDQALWQLKQESWQSILQFRRKMLIYGVKLALQR